MKSYLIFLVIGILCLQNLRAKNPLADFYSKTKCETNSVLLSLDISGCVNCFAPADHLIRMIKNANDDIPIYIILRDSLSKLGEITYGIKNNIDSNDVKYYYNEDLHSYLLNKTEGMPNIAVISEQHTILSLRNLKTDDLGNTFKLIRPELKLRLNKKIPLLNPYVKLDLNYSGILFYEKDLFVYVPSFGMISKYNKEGENLKNFFIDSLNLNYLELTKTIFTEEDYASNLIYFEKNKPKKSSLLSPVSIMKIGENLLGINMEISSFKDSTYKKLQITIQQSYKFMLVVDKNFKLVNTLRFNYPISKQVEFLCQGVYSDSVFYFFKLDPEHPTSEEYLVSEFKQIGSDLILTKEFQQPFLPKRRDPLQMMSNTGSVSNSLYICYHNARGNKTRIYKRDIPSKGYWPEITIKNSSAEALQFYETKKGNYLFLATGNGDFLCRGYDSNTEKLVNCEESNLKVNNQNKSENPVYFLKNGYLCEVSYTE